jgi:hypothetical protein
LPVIIHNSWLIHFSRNWHALMLACLHSLMINHWDLSVLYDAWDSIHMFLLLCDVAFKPTLTQPPAIAQMAVEETWWWYERM